MQLVDIWGRSGTQIVWLSVLVLNFCFLRTWSMCKVKFPCEIFPWELSEKKPQSTNYFCEEEATSMKWFSAWAAHWDDLESLKKCSCPGPAPGESDLIALWRGQDLGLFFWKLLSFDSNVQPRWTLIESKLTSQINSVNFLRGCAHSAFPVCGLISIRRILSLSTQRSSKSLNYLAMINNRPYTGLRKAGNC